MATDYTDYTDRLCYSFQMIVMKFGGTSVEDAAAMDRSCRIVAQRVPRRPFVVVSALAGTTNGLLEAGRLAADRQLDRALAIAGDLERRHVELLPSTAQDFSQLRELLRALSAIGELSARTRDLIASYGEAMSSLIFTDRLKRHGHDAVHVDARRAIVSDASFGNATPVFEATAANLEQLARPHIDAGRIVVMGGYIASTASGVTTTLGRGASDYSASIVGAAMGAEEIQIWTDVDGMLTADPRWSETHTKSRKSHSTKLRNSRTSARKFFIRCRCCRRSRKTFRFTSSTRESRTAPERGSQRKLGLCKNLIKSIACKRGITAVTVSSSRMLMAHGFLGALFEVFDKHRTSVDMVATSEVSVSLTLDNTSALPAIIEELKALGDVTVNCRSRR